MPAPSQPHPPLPVAHGPTAVTRTERSPVPPWRATAGVWLLVVGGALLLHGAPRWQAATQVAGLAWAVRLAGHRTPAARVQALVLVVVVVVIDVLGAVLPGPWLR
jgi:uncharacterized membrane protein YidH (DUF202 family)